MKRGRDLTLVARETELREKLSASPTRSPDARMVEMREDISRIIRKEVEQLESAYFKDWNPIHVWEALFRIQGTIETGRIPEIPPWVMAYLFNAADEIIWSAVVDWTDRRQPQVPNVDPSGTKTLTAAQRRDVALRALGFKAQGWNPFAQAHRDQKRKMRLSLVEQLMAKGLSKKAAAREAAVALNDVELKMSADLPRKIRRDRRRLGGET
jgi:hypothetical protein